MLFLCTFTELTWLIHIFLVAQSTNNLLLGIKFSHFWRFIFQAPTELGEFKNLFLFLGASLNPSVDQYAMVLKQIWKQTSGTKMHPNEIRAAFKVRWIRDVYLWKNYYLFIFWTNVVNIIFLKGLLTVFWFIQCLWKFTFCSLIPSVFPYLEICTQPEIHNKNFLLQNWFGYFMKDYKNNTIKNVLCIVGCARIVHYFRKTSKRCNRNWGFISTVHDLLTCTNKGKSSHKI